MSNKYGARRTVVDGHLFDSIAEARRYSELRMTELAGGLRDLELQPSFELLVNGIKVGVYRADFRYMSPDSGAVVVEDVKGFRTPTYRLKRKLVEAIYGIEIVEVAA